MLDTRDRPRREEPEQRVPGEGRAVREPQLQTAVGDEARRVAAPGSQLARRETEHLLDDAVHLPDRLEAGRGRDLRHGQIGVVEQPPGEVRATRTRDLARSRADVLGEQAPQMARAHAESRREIVLGGVVERAVDDEAQGAAHELGRVDPRRVRFAVGPAAQARPEAVRFGGGGEGIRDACCARAVAPLHPSRQ